MKKELSEQKEMTRQKLTDAPSNVECAQACYGASVSDQVDQLMEMSLFHFLVSLGLEAFEKALLEVTGLQPCLRDFALYVRREDLQMLLQPPHCMKMPQFRKLWAAIESLPSLPQSYCCQMPCSLTSSSFQSSKAPDEDMSDDRPGGV